MGSEQETAEADAAQPAIAPASSPHPRWSPRRWARAVNDRVPTKWVATIGTTLFLAATAAFGGMAEVAATPTPELKPGETFIGAEMQMSVVSVEVADKRYQSGVSPADDGSERVVSVILDVVNLDEEARQSYTLGSLRSVSLIDTTTLKTAEPSIARVDDGTFNPYLPPDVPVQVVLSWLVDADLLIEGDELRIALPQATEVVGSMVTSGEYLTDITTGALVVASVIDVGTGTTSPGWTP